MKENCTIPRIVEISNYLKEKYNCKNCGQILKPSDVTIRETQFKNGKIQFGADCPDCYTFIRWMPTNIINKVWWKGSAQEIASFDTSTLQWMLRVKYGNSDTIHKNITKVLIERVDMEPIGDYKVNVKEETLLKQIAVLNDGLPVVEEKYYQAQDKLVKESHGWGYYEVDKQRKIVEALYKNMIKQREELDKIKKLLLDIKKSP